jgi:hypothetical protein
MDQRRIQWLGQIFAALGVTISLCLVAYEMNLARDVALADVYQQRVAMDLSYRLHLLDSKEVVATNQKVLSEEGVLSEKETWILVNDADVAIMGAENAFYQYQLGLFDEEEWMVWRYNMKWMLETTCYRSYFNFHRQGFRKEFAAEVDSLYLEIPESDCILDKTE